MIQLSIANMNGLISWVNITGGKINEISAKVKHKMLIVLTINLLTSHG